MFTTARVGIYLALILSCFSVLAEKRVFNIYHDSDYSNHGSSANAMYMGFLTALSAQKHQFANIEFNLIKKDHRGNSNRSLLHMKQFLNDPDALFMLGGLHSPPYIKHKSFIAKNELLLLVPWAAGGPITRYAEPKNWVFRLSVDDTKAGYRIAQFAKQQKKCKSPQLLLESTPWGESNERTMTKALSGISSEQVTWFNWNTKLNQAKIILRNIVDSGADCVLFVGNAVEGNNFVQAMASLPKQLPIISHWGITGGDFYEKTKGFLATGLELNFIQSCFSFRNKPYSDFTQQVVKRALKQFPEHFSKPELLAAPAGFIHSHDLATVFVAALQQVALDKPIKHIRASLRDQLEHIEQPVQGLVKTYHRPFSPWQASNPDAHEALSLDDLCMAKYESDGGIRVFSNE